MMSLIRVSHLSFTYDGGIEPVFQDASFEWDTDWKLGLTGRNGRGKTTLLRLLMGELEYRGSIAASTGFDYFPFPTDRLQGTAGEAALAVGQCEEWRIVRECSLLGLEDEALERPFGSLSHGERAKVLLAALFSRENRYLLIDEPTNHLDMQARRQVAGYLRRQEKGFLLISHDRAFLDRCVDHVMSIERTGVLVHKGNFSTYLEEKQRREASEAAQRSKLEKEIARLSQAAGQTASWSGRAERAKYRTDSTSGSIDRGYAGHKAAKVMKRAKQMQQRSERAMEEKKGLLQNLEISEPLKLAQLPYPGDRLAELRHVTVLYGHKEALRDCSLTIRTGERLALSGPTGSGKTTLLRLLLGELSPSEGEVILGSHLQISYVPQDTSAMTGGVREYARRAGVEESLYLALLRKLGFSRALFERDLAQLSAGQRKKAAIARSLCERAHLHIWDEPLNYIDVISRMQIEELIVQCRPTLVFVEHDEAFVQRVATEICHLGRADG